MSSAAAVVILAITIIMPGDIPNKEATSEVPSLEKCVEIGSAFVQQDPREYGALALGFSCAVGRNGDPA